MGMAVIPPGLLFGLVLLSSEGWGQIFPKQRNTHCWIFLRALPPMFLPYNDPWSPAFFPGDPPRTAIRSDPVSHGASALPWDPVHMKVCVCLSRMGSPFPPVPWSSCTQAPLAFNARCSKGLSPSDRSPHVGVWCGAQNSDSCKWVSVNQLVSSLWGFPPRRYGVVYIM